MYQIQKMSEKIAPGKGELNKFILFSCCGFYGKGEGIGEIFHLKSLRTGSSLLYFRG